VSAFVPGPWEIGGDAVDPVERGLPVIAILPDAEGATPTRGMVAWVHSGVGACATDEQAIATARLMAAAPDLLNALHGLIGLVQLIIPTLAEPQRSAVADNHRLVDAIAAIAKATAA
jgi:hypothetical protein